MSSLEWKRIRVDWEELEEAFVDAASEHRYYLDRETGAVHFFSSYLDNEEEEEDERAITSEERYVRIPHEPAVADERVAEFVANLKDVNARKVLTSTLRAPGGYQRFREAVETLPAAKKEWRAFSHEALEARIKTWLAEVSVEPL